MNKQALNELQSKCRECITAWKRENWFKPLDIEEGNFIEHCRMYGGNGIQELYEEVWDGVEEEDPEVQQALSEVEHYLYVLNISE